MPNRRTAKRSFSARSRLDALDTLRGLTLLSMLFYHTVWDLIFLVGFDFPWFSSRGAYWWQQSICWAFIFLSGLCWPLGQRHLRRGVQVFAAGALVSLVTLTFLPKEPIIFGVLTFLGSAMLLMIPLDAFLQRCPNWLGFLGSAGFFVLTRNINIGFLGFEKWNWFALPGLLYKGYFATYLGFMDPAFYSTDYFSLLPWLFLFCCGYFAGGALKTSAFLQSHLKWGLAPLSWLGRNSLLFYLLHQPALTLFFTLWLTLKGNAGLSALLPAL